MSDQRSPGSGDPDERTDRDSDAGERADRDRDPSAAGAVEAVAADESEFSTVTMQFYRGGTDRMATWRTRLDQTTNWAVVVMAAVLTWAFSSADNPHYVLLIGSLAVGAFAVIEANRYQEYDVWRSRVRTVEAGFLGPVFATGDGERRDWRDELGADLVNPRLRLSFWRAVGHRLHRVYFLLLSVLLTAWLVRITVYEPGAPWQRTAAITGVPGPAVVAGVGLVYLVLAGLTAWSVHRAVKREFDDDSASR